MTTLFLVLSSLALAAVAASVPAVRLLTAHREVRVYREAAGDLRVDSGDRTLRSARDLLIGADGWFASAQGHLFREALGFRRRDHRVLDLLHGTGAVMHAHRVLRTENWHLVLDIPADVPALADPIAAHRLGGLWPITSILERMPRTLRGIYCYLKLRGQIAALRAESRELLDAIHARLALSTWGGGEAPERSSFRSYLEFHTAKHQLISAQGDLNAARRRLIWESVGIDNGERRQADLLRATADIRRAWFSTTRSMSRYDIDTEAPTVPGFIDPVVAAALDGRWFTWGLLVLSPRAVRGIYRSMKVRPQIRELQVTVEEILEAFDTAEHEDREPMVAIAAK